MVDSAANPYSKEMHLGQSEVKPHFFKVEVLDRYFENPGYDVSFFDFSGKFSWIDTNARLKSRDDDSAYMQTFGLGYDEDGLPLVVVYLVYLSRLPTKHQLHWKSFQLDSYEGCAFSNQYYKTSVLGEWPMHYSVYGAVIEEQVEINKICGLTNRPRFYRKTFRDKRPPSFHVILKPTRKAFDEFVLVLTKMTIDNLNSDFFMEISQKDGKGVSKGSVQIFEEWINQVMNPTDSRDCERIIKPLRELLKPRREYAHRIYDNELDTKWITAQRELVNSVYESVTLTRLTLSHLVKNNYEPPPALDRAIKC